MPIQAASLYATVSVAGAEDSVGKLRRVDSAVDQTQGRMNRLAGGGAQAAKGVGQVAGGLTRLATLAGAAALTAVGASAKISASFEDAFANVEKTVGGAPEDLKRLDQQLRNLTTSIPVGYTGLTTIAAEAGALGVAAKDVAKFTEAVARTSAATVGLDEFAASEAFGKLTTLFGLTSTRVDDATGKIVSDFDRLGSSLVALGNEGASSEADIIEVTKRFAAAGQAAGLSAADVLGWSSALASLGPRADAAGGALQRIFNNATRNIALMNEPGLIGKNARKRVSAFAMTTGMTVDEFVAFHKRDSSAALQKVMESLGGMDKYESSRALFGMGIINQRDILAVQNFTERYNVLNDQLEISRKAWKEGTELQHVSETRFDTLKSHAIEFKNQVLLAAVALGEGGMNGALGRLLTKAKTFVQTHMGDITRLGGEIGKAIDEIDWSKVEGGARRLVDLGRDFIDILRKIPGEVTLGVAAFLGLNKLSGGLIGTGITNIVAGLGKMFANILVNGLTMALPGTAGGALGALTGMRVYVVNWPPAMLAGGAAGAGGVVAGGGKLGTVMGLVQKVFIVGMLAEVASLIARPVQDLGTSLGEQIPFFLKERQEAGQAIFGADKGIIPSLRDSIRDLATAVDRNTSGNPDERRGPGTRNTSGGPDDRGAAQLAAALKDPAAIAGKARWLADLGAIGSKDDPFGFKHIKTFAYGKLGKNDPLGMAGELKWHIGEVDKAIARAQEKGDPKTVAKLRETKAALEEMLRQVKAGTYRAGDKAYEGALRAAAAARGTTDAILRLPSSLAAVMRGLLPGPIRNSSGSPDDRDGAPRRTSSGSTTAAHAGALSKYGRIYATGGVGLAKMPQAAMFGEAGTEGVAIIRNPRRFDGPLGDLAVDVHPAPVRILLDSREIGSGLLRQQAFTRRRS